MFQKKVLKEDFAKKSLEIKSGLFNLEEYLIFFIKSPQTPLTRHKKSFHK